MKVATCGIIRDRTVKLGKDHEYLTRVYWMQALDLVQSGYHSIEQVRIIILSGRLRLTRNQLVGVECYEEILEEMSRDEVECIGDIVINTFQSLCNSSAEVTITGSYRRGKATSGDVDVLITLEEYSHSVAHSALQELVDLLWDKGHVAFHLTYLSGMKTGVLYSNESGSQESKKPAEFALPIVRPRQDSIARKSKSFSYMGVFYSPKIPGKRRRVDIKIYPYAQKAFACLYFTGSAQFNRSMRLWAKQQFSLRLTDRGLFDIVTGKLLTEASDEREVFKQLKLCFKAPPDRSFFDDVVPLTSSS
jgi:DNA polymerase/3'-5' exonuclease PolX